MARPGIMLYFDILEPIRVLPDEDKGRLLIAILEYGQDGTLPKFDGMLAMAWGFVRPKIDRDGESYENAKVQRKYASFCKKLLKLNRPKIPFEEWLDMTEDERERMLTESNEPKRPVDFDESRYPTTNTTRTTTGTTTTPTTTKTNTAISTAVAVTGNTETDFAAATADRKLKRLYGQLGQGVVNLTEEQMNMLLEELGLEMFDYYVKKLSDFIIKKGASVKNHYETILKWWNEDNSL